MVTKNSAVFAAAQSLKQHIIDHWGSDLYDPVTQEQTRVGYCPSALEDMLKYKDREGNERIFGPCVVNLGRLQDDVTNLAGNYLVPSAYIEIVLNDYEEIESWRHSMYRSHDPSRKVGPDYPVMVGNEHAANRRIIAKMVTFFLESDQDIEDVYRLGNAAVSFLESLCTAFWEMPHDWGWKLADEEGGRIKDIFGETYYAVYTPMTHTRVRGGPPDDYIFDIKVYVELSGYKSS